MKTIIKRDGRVVPFDVSKIAVAMKKAFLASKTSHTSEDKVYEICLGYASAISAMLDAKYTDPIDIEDIQNEVELFLMSIHPPTAKAYILYRQNRSSTRKLMQTYHGLATLDAADSDLKRENANIDGNTAMGTMLKFGSEGAKAYYDDFVLSSDSQKAHADGDIHIHDKDFYTLTTTCTQIDLIKLFEGGFCTGHGYLREPNSIVSYAALAAIAIQANQNDQHGGQSVPNFDRSMAIGVRKSFRKAFTDRLIFAFELIDESPDSAGVIKAVILDIEDETGKIPTLERDGHYLVTVAEAIKQASSLNWEKCLYIVERAYEAAVIDTDRQTHQAMEAFVHNLNTMHSRAGAQVPFSSINYGTDTSPEGRLVIKNVLLATEEGLGNGETPIFPIQIFRMKKGINYDEGDPNYDLFKLACRVSAKRLFPNFSFQDAPFNIQFYDPNRPETEIAYMGCRTRVIANVHDPESAISYGRGNLSFTSINLPRLAIEAVRNNPTLSVISQALAFEKALDDMMELVVRQLLDRFKIQRGKKVKNFPFLMGQGVWLGSDKLGFNDSVSEILKHGTLSIGFIGLAEALTMLTGKHHGESRDAQLLGLRIIQRMRDFCDARAAEMKLNFTLVATPAEGLSGRFVGIDKERYGVIAGVTDKEYYTNSFHIPVGYNINAYEKISLEAPYHEMTNAGHITYVEMDGDPTQNLDAFESIIKCMGTSGVGYGAINHPADHDPVCGFNGIINNECPRCGRREENGQSFERIRRITGYLVGTVDRFNNAKRAEELDRVKHRY